jgi:hypothetical protein
MKDYNIIKETMILLKKLEFKIRKDKELLLIVSK